MYTLDPHVKAIWSITGLIRTILVSIGIFTAEIIFPKLIPLPVGILAGLVFVLGVIYSIVYPALKYRYWRFDVKENELYVERGVFTRIRTVAPFVRLQHLDVEQNIIERMMHLAKLVVYTAGTRGADIIIPGLPLEYAEQLRDQLKNFSPEDAV